MYTEITTRCNMRCLHCGFSRTERGNDMTIDTLKNVIEFHKKTNAFFIDLGGGEATLHHKLFDAIDLCFKNNLSVGVITNGKLKRPALDLLRIMKETKGKKPYLCVNLSQSIFHEEINYEVIRSFQNYFLKYDQEVIATQDVIFNSGRAKRLSKRYLQDRGLRKSKGAFAEITRIDPFGNIISGGKNSIILGNVNDKDPSKRCLSYFNANDWDDINNHANYLYWEV